MISRHWIGVVRHEKVNDYLSHLEKSVFPNLNKIPGLKNSYYLKRDLQQGVEFLIVTEWDSIESIKIFAGPDYANAVVDPRAKEMLISYDRKVRHYTI